MSLCASTWHSPSIKLTASLALSAISKICQLLFNDCLLDICFSLLSRSYGGGEFFMCHSDSVVVVDGLIVVFCGSLICTSHKWMNEWMNECKHYINSTSWCRLFISASPQHCLLACKHVLRSESAVFYFYSEVQTFILLAPLYLSSIFMVLCLLYMVIIWLHGFLYLLVS